MASERGDSDQSVKEVDRIWFDLVNDWNEHLRAKPTTNRYTTPPEHLRGLVTLKKDESSLLLCGRVEKAAGEEMREAAISVIAEERKSSSKEHEAGASRCIWH